MRPMMIAVLVIAAVNGLFGILNIFLTPEEYKMYGNLVIFSLLAIEMICASIVIHSPLKDVK